MRKQIIARKALVGVAIVPFALGLTGGGLPPITSDAPAGSVSEAQVALPNKSIVRTFGPFDDLGRCLNHAASLVFDGWVVLETCSPEADGWYNVGRLG